MASKLEPAASAGVMIWMGALVWSRGGGVLRSGGSRARGRWGSRRGAGEVQCGDGVEGVVPGAGVGGTPAR